MATDASFEVRSNALRLLSNGLYVLTACQSDTIHAAAVSWVTQASFQPPLVLIALQRNSRLVQAVRQAHRFALNILAADQERLAEKFFGHLTLPVQTTDLVGSAFRPDPAHCPLLMDALGWLECRLAAEPTTPGDHSLLLGEVTAAGLRRAGAPMVLWQTPWAYGGLK